MSQYDKTIDPTDTWQSGSGSAADATPEDLDVVKAAIKAYKAVEIRNINATGVNLLVGYGADNAPLYKLPQGQTVTLEVRHPDKIRVSGDGDTVLYTWLSY